ncbi:MAG TPA: hypothetical protein DD670_07945 [Planctomycetaceae bacterium]|nr:hypothetical protein [Planctomycetaceae bacterium]
MRCSLRTFLVLCVVFGSSFAAFGPWGIGIVAGVVVGVVAIFAFHAITHVAWTTMALWAVFGGVVGLFVVALWPQSSAVPEAQRSVTCVNNLKSIALALFNYHDAHGCFPPTVVRDAQGRPMHSWRVLLLPYLDEDALYREYNFNEPWNGPNNRRLAARMPRVFQCPGAKKDLNQTRTSYVAVTGPGTLWPDSGRIALGQIADAPADTLLLVEVADSDIDWLEPRDMRLDALVSRPASTTGVPSSSRHKGRETYFFRSTDRGGLIALADGSIDFLAKPLSHEDLSALASIDGGETINWDRITDDSNFVSVRSVRWEHVVGLILFIVSLVWLWRYRVAGVGKGSDDHRDAEARREQ